VPTNGTNEATIASTPKTTGDGMRVIQNAMPMRVPCDDRRHERAEHDRARDLLEVAAKALLARRLQRNQPHGAGAS
jgi:hypothetical protein